MSPGDLDHAVLLERLARDGRRLDGHVRVGERLEVDPVGAGRAHAAADLVVAEDHRAVHRGQRAGRLAEPAVERVGGRVVLDLRRAARRTCPARRSAPLVRLRAWSAGPLPPFLAAHTAVHRNPGAATCDRPAICGGSESMPAVEGKPIEQVRAMWAAYARGGVDAMHARRRRRARRVDPARRATSPCRPSVLGRLGPPPDRAGLGDRALVRGARDVRDRPRQHAHVQRGRLRRRAAELGLLLPRRGARARRRATRRARRRWRRSAAGAQEE